MIKSKTLATVVAVFLGTAAHAECAFENEVEIRMLSASFPAWVGVTDAMKECGNVEAELNNEFLEKMKEGFRCQPAPVPHRWTLRHGSCSSHGCEPHPAA